MANKQKLSDRLVASARCPADKRNILIPDGAGNGLCLYVSNTGTKLWKFRYDFAGRRNGVMTIGEFPLMKYDEAAEKAAALQRTVKIDKRDPKVGVYNPKTAADINDVLDHYLTTLDPKATPTVVSAFKPVRKKFGATLLLDLTRKSLAAWIGTEYAARVDKPQRTGAAKTLLRYLSAAFNAATRETSGIKVPAGFSNPATRLGSEIALLKLHKQGSHAVAFEDDQWSAIFAAISDAHKDPTIGSIGLMAIELLVVTGARPSEIVSLKWDEVDHVRGEPDLRHIIKDRHKTYARTSRSRQIVVGRVGVGVLERAADHARVMGYQGEYVFPPVRQLTKAAPHFNSANPLTKVLSAKSGVDFRPYNLRSAYINHALASAEGTSLEAFQAALAVVAENVGHAATATTLKFYSQSKQSARNESAKVTDAAFDRFRPAD